MKNCTCLLFLACMLSRCPGRACSELSDQELKTAYKRIDQDTAQDMMESEEDYMILDVRDQREFREGHIPGALNVPNVQLEDGPPPQLTDKDQMIFVYCHSGHRSLGAADLLCKMGFTRVYQFDGISEWTGEIVKD